MVNNDTLYFCDNGAVYCGAHLGVTARMTSRDRSGQTIERVTTETAAYALEDGWTIKCEQCGKVAQ